MISLNFCKTNNSPQIDYDSIALVEEQGKGNMSNEYKEQVEQFTQYLTLLTEHDNKTEIPIICTQQFSDKKKEAWNWGFWDIDDVRKRFEKFYKQNVDEKIYTSVAVNEFGFGGAEEVKRKKKDVTRVRAFVVDCDKFLTPEQIDKVVKKTKPTFLVRTSKLNNKFKVHLYYRVSHVLDDSAELWVIKNYNIIQKALAMAVDKLLGIEGCCDRSITLEKVMRAPGLWHQKDSNNKSIVKLVELNGPDVEVDDRFFKQVGITEEILKEAKKKKERTPIDCSGVGSGYLGADSGGRNNAMFEFLLDFQERKEVSEEILVGIAKHIDLEANDPPFQNDPEEENEPECIARNVFQIYINRLTERKALQVIKGEPLVVKAIFKKRAELIRAELEKNLVELTGLEEVDQYKKLFLNYKYDHDEYKFTKSDTAIIRRVYDAFGPTLRYSDDTGAMGYVAEAGVWDIKQGEMLHHKAVCSVVNSMSYEPIVQDTFPLQIDFNDSPKKKKADEPVVTYSKEDLEAWGTNVVNSSKINSLVNRISKDIRFSIDVNTLDTACDLLNTPNGIIDLISGKLLPHDPDKYFTSVTRGYVNDKRVRELKDMQTVEEWNSNLFSSLIFKYSCGDLELARFLQVLLGHTLFGAVKEEKTPLFLGDGANGKSTILQLCAYALGGFGSTAPKALVVDDKFASENRYTDFLANLRSKRFVVVDDMKDNIELSPEKLKQLSSGGEINARALGKSNFNYQVRYNIFMQANSKPLIQGDDNGIWRRILNVGFNYTIPANEQDGSYRDKLRAQPEVLNYILDWLIGGALRYNQEGLIIPESVAKINEDNRIDQLPVHTFVKDMFDVCWDKGEAIDSNTLFDIWAFYVHINNLDIDSPAIPKTTRGMSRKIKGILEKTTGRKYTAREFRNSSGDVLLPIILKEGAFKREFNSEGTQQQLSAMRGSAGDNVFKANFKEKKKLFSKR